MGNPNQPRVPAGSPEGGQFAEGSGGGGRTEAKRERQLTKGLRGMKNATSRSGMIKAMNDVADARKSLTNIAMNKAGQVFSGVNAAGQRFTGKTFHLPTIEKRNARGAKRQELLNALSSGGVRSSGVADGKKFQAVTFSMKQVQRQARATRSPRRGK